MGKKKTYGAKGEKYLDDLFKDAIGIGVNVAIKHMMKDVEDMKGNTHVYDVSILVNNVQIQRLTSKLTEIDEDRKEIYNKIENLKNDLKELDTFEKDIRDELFYLEEMNKKYTENKKETNRILLNQMCNNVLLKYKECNEKGEKFDALNIQSVIDDSNIELNVNVVVGYLRNGLDALDTSKTINLHDEKGGGDVRLKISRMEVEKIMLMLDDLRY